MIRTYRTSNGSKLFLEPEADGSLYLVMTNPAVYTGSGGEADIMLTRGQVASLALALVELLGRDHA